MPSKPKLCPDCDDSMSPRSKHCRVCSHPNKYDPTPEEIVQMMEQLRDEREAKYAQQKHTNAGHSAAYQPKTYSVNFG